MLKRLNITLSFEVIVLIKNNIRTLLLLLLLLFGKAIIRVHVSILLQNLFEKTIMC